MSEDEKKEDGEPKPCLLDRWLSEAHSPQELPQNPEAYEKIIGETVDKVEDKLVEMLYETIQGDCGYSLFQKLRGIHIALSGQLGLVEEWMRTEIRRNMANVDPEIVDQERERMLDMGTEHVMRHIALGVVGDNDEEDDEDDEPELVH